MVRCDLLTCSRVLGGIPHRHPVGRVVAVAKTPCFTARMHALDQATPCVVGVGHAALPVVGVA